MKELILKSYPENTPEYTYAKTIRKTTFGSSNWTSGIKDEDGVFEELDILHNYFQLVKVESTRKKACKEAVEKLNEQVVGRYATLTETEIKTLVVEYKWFASLRAAIASELEKIAQKFASRVHLLDRRYSQPLSELEQEVDVFSTKVEEHLKEMGLVWG